MAGLIFIVIIATDVTPTRPGLIGIGWSGCLIWRARVARKRIGILSGVRLIRREPGVFREWL